MGKKREQRKRERGGKTEKSRERGEGGGGGEDCQKFQVEILCVYLSCL